MTGYLHPLYAKSLSEFGTPVEPPQCGGWLLERRIPNFDLKDAMGATHYFIAQTGRRWLPTFRNYRHIRF